MQLNHESSKYWLCFACTDAETSVIFWRNEDFMKHMKLKHSDAVSTKDISKLSTICERITPITMKICPLCIQQPQNENIDPEILLDHIADHIQEFSLLSLPRLNEVVTEGNISEETRLEGQAKDDKPKLGRWLAQAPKDDGVPFAWRETQEPLTEETRSEEQPKEDKLKLDRWPAQDPEDDSVLTVNLRQTQGALTKGTRSGGQAKDDDIPVDFIHHVAGWPVTGENNWSLANRIPPYHHQNTQRDCGQQSSNTHDTKQPENLLSYQQQEHPIHVPLSSAGQETLGQPFNQSSMPSDPPGTADYSGTSYGAIQQNLEDDQWLNTTDTTCIHEIIPDRRRTLLQHLGMLQHELSTIESSFANQQPFAPARSIFNSNLYSSHGYSADSTSITHAARSFGHLDINQPRGYISPHHPNLIPSQLSAYSPLMEPWRYRSNTIPSYSSDTHSRAVDDVSSEMTFSTAPTSNSSLYRSDFGSYNLNPAQVLLSNPVSEPAVFLMFGAFADFKIRQIVQKQKNMVLKVLLTMQGEE